MGAGEKVAAFVLIPRYFVQITWANFELAELRINLARLWVILIKKCTNLSEFPKILSELLGEFPTALISKTNFELSRLFLEKGSHQQKNQPI